jgi:hypothetical protein
MSVARKIASQMTFFSNSNGTTKDTALPLQDDGMKMKDALYVIFVNAGTANVKLGLKHNEGPSPDTTYFLTHSTPIAVAVPTAVPGTIKGVTVAANGPLQPYYQPVVQVGSTGATQESFTGDVYVFGKPF